MKASALREMKKDELRQKLDEFRGALFNLTFQHKTGQLENTAQLDKTRKSIARVLSILNELDHKTTV
jgi:large subunit ribosomal protein L29